MNNAMTDREMLEMAAKAAGNIALIHNANTGEKYFGVVPDNKHCHGGIARWNPLTDDGDALRLAVRLRMCIDTNWERTEETLPGVFWPECEEHENDPLASTRRAIVRAAAEIGRQMIEENKS